MERYVESAPRGLLPACAFGKLSGLGRVRKNAHRREFERGRSALFPLCAAQGDHAKQRVIDEDAFSMFVAGRHEEMSFDGPDLLVQFRRHPHALEAPRYSAFAEDFHPVGCAAQEDEASVYLADALVDLAEERPPWQLAGDGSTPPSDSRV